MESPIISTPIESLTLSEVRERFGQSLHELPALMAQPDEALNALQHTFHLLIRLQKDREYLRLLESLRPFVYQICDIHVADLAGKGLPYPHYLERKFVKLIYLHRSLLEAYAHLYNEIETKSMRAVLINQRLLAHLREIAIIHYTARRALPERFWQDFHRIFRRIEKQKYETLQVDEIDNGALTHTTCLSTYLSALLIDVASPYNQRYTDLALIIKWAKSWAPKLTLERLPTQGIPGQIIDLASDAPLSPVNAQNQYLPSYRVLDTQPLAMEIQRMQHQILNDFNLESLGLPQEQAVTAAQVIALLDRVSLPWTQLFIARRFKRYPNPSPCRVTSNFLDIHGALAYYNDLLDEQGQEGVKQNQPTTPLLACEEQWMVVNHSAQGYCISKAVDGKKINHGDLILLKRDDEEHAVLGCVAWLMQEGQSQILAGISFFPGTPIPCIVNSESDEANADTDSDSDGEDNSWCGFLLQAVSTIDQRNSLILPPEVPETVKSCTLQYARSQQNIDLDNIIDQQTDFRRVYFSMH